MKALFLILAMLVSAAALAPASAAVLPPHCDPWLAPNPHPTPTPPPTGADDFTSLPRPTPVPVPVPAEPPTSEAYGPCPQETPPPSPTPTPTPVPSDPPATEEPLPTDDPNQVVDPGMPVLEGSGCSLNGAHGFSGDVGALVGLGIGLLGLRRRHRA